MLSPIFHPASRLWMLGKIENHTARPLTREEVEARITEHERLRALAEKSEAAPDSGFLPCPFCGRPVGYVAKLRGRMSVVCDPCDVYGPGAWTEEEAIRRWNVRGSQDADERPNNRRSNEPQKSHENE